MRRLAALALGSALLAGCGGLASTLPAAAPVTYVGRGATPVPLAQLDAELARLQRELEQRIAGQSWPMPVQVMRSPEAYLRVRFGADESFVPASAQLRPEALLAYASIGEVVTASPSVVAHIVVHGDAPAQDPAADLTARRAASVLNYLVTRGAPAPRLRAEGRADREPATVEPGAGAVNRRVDIVLRPVVAGSEAVAWMPPPSQGCRPCDTP